MTGRELVGWIHENHAEDMEVLYVDSAETVWAVKPTIERGADIAGEGPDGERPDDGEVYIVL